MFGGPRPGPAARPRAAYRRGVISSSCASRSAGLAYVERQVSDVPATFGSVLDGRPSRASRRTLAVGADDGSGWRPATPCCAAGASRSTPTTWCCGRSEEDRFRAPVVPRDFWVLIAAAREGQDQPRPWRSVARSVSCRRSSRSRHQDQPLRDDSAISCRWSTASHLLPGRHATNTAGSRTRPATTLEPEQALAYARSRHFEIYDEKTRRYVSIPRATRPDQPSATVHQGRFRGLSPRVCGTRSR